MTRGASLKRTAGARHLAGAGLRLPDAALDRALRLGLRGADQRRRRRRLVGRTVVKELHPTPVESAVGGGVPLAAEPHPFLAQIVGIDHPVVHEVVVLPPEGIVRVEVAAGRAAAVAVAVEAESLETLEVVAAGRRLRIDLGRIGAVEPFLRWVAVATVGQTGFPDVARRR